jgi:AhpD family alkylhydroperoxidase
MDLTFLPETMARPAGAWRRKPRAAPARHDAGGAKSPPHEIEWQAPLIEPQRDPGAEAMMRKKYGFVMDSAAFYSRSPWILRSQERFDIQRDLLVHVGIDLAEIVGLVVSQDNSCRFCYAAWRALLRFQGYTERRIERLEQDLAGSLSPCDRLAVDFARGVARANPIPSREEWRRLEAAGIGRDAIKELAFVATLNVYYNRLATLLAVPTVSVERAARNARPDWTLPVRGWYARARRRRGRTAPLPAERRTGPFSPAVLALDGLPVALALRDVIDDAWGSSALPVRTKAFVFAVVARGLGSDWAERQARSMLLAEGMTPQGYDDGLAHLSGPELTPAEAALGPLVRETVFYRTPSLQRHAHRVCPSVSAEEFLEFVGIAALANAVCRLSAIVHDR